MSVYAARQFLRSAISDAGLRKSLNACMTLPDLQQELEARQLLFTADELDDAWYNSLTLCANESEALRLRETVVWFQMLVNLLQEAI
ncbi:MAG: hypothetical protein D6B26_05315 [Spirochaetaceae bacterium]|nr:MAG: hypothetical protein D6B26_05315 [Spirochaetaceae bacterium]